MNKKTIQSHKRLGQAYQTNSNKENSVENKYCEPNTTHSSQKNKKYLINYPFKQTSLENDSNSDHQNKNKEKKLQLNQRAMIFENKNKQKAYQIPKLPLPSKKYRNNSMSKRKNLDQSKKVCRQRVKEEPHRKYQQKYGVAKNTREAVENSQQIREDGAFPIKLVTIGDACVGKTSMLISYTTNQFPTDHVPTIFQNYAADVICDSRKIKLCLWDTAGQEEYQQIRFLSYHKTDIFLICFSMVDHNSFHNAVQKWLPEASQECPKAFKIFVGTKNDIHSQYQGSHDTKHLAIPLKIILREVEARKCQFLSCNSLTQKGLNQVFTTAIRKVVKKSERCRQQKQSQCQLI